MTRKVVIIALAIVALSIYFARPKMLNRDELIGTWKSKEYPLILKLFADSTFHGQDLPKDFFGTANLAPVTFETTGTWSIVQEGLTRVLRLSPSGIPTPGIGFPTWGLNKHQIKFRMESGFVLIYKVH